MIVKAFKLILLSTFLVASFAFNAVAQEDYNETVMHHIGNANEFHIVGDIHMPLPCILYSSDNGLKMFMSSEFHHGSQVHEGYVLDHGVVKRLVGYGGAATGVHIDPIKHDEKSHEDHGHNDAHEGEHNHDAEGHDDEKGDGEKPQAEKDHDHNAHYVYHRMVKDEDGKENEEAFVHISGKEYKLEKSMTLIDLVYGEKKHYDFSLSKNVFSMLLATLLLFIVFGAVAKGYKKREGKAPKGIQSFMEPLIIFIRDEVAIPAIGPKWEKYFPFILSLFFFVLVNNLFGLIPFFPFSSNVTGNVSTTMALAVLVFLVTNFSGNKHYWGHVLWMPGIPTFVKPILSVIEILGLFIKPFTLFIRLFANITAGHIIVLSLVGLIWQFGDMGANLGGSVIGAVVSFLFVSFMNVLELFVSFLQAFIFALLSALYIGGAVEEHHHDGEHAH
jgi:F-type H+-transporting ATPase subunit a